MKLKKFFKKAERLFNADEVKRQERIKNIKKLLKKLRKHEKTLAEKLKKPHDDATTAKLENKLALVHAQRSKGVALLKELQTQKK